jgi:PleD family two-component response regulator
LASWRDNKRKNQSRAKAQGKRSKKEANHKERIERKKLFYASFAIFAVNKSPKIEIAMAGKRILVIEDHEENRRLLRDLLTSFGYELIEAVTGEEGLTSAEAQVPRSDPYGYPTSGD